MTDSTAILRLVVKEEVSTQMAKARQELDKTKKSTSDLKGQVIDLFKDFAKAASVAYAANLLKNFAVSSIHLADALEGMENRARVIFGDAFPRMSVEANRMGEALGRSGSNILDMQTSMAGMLKSVGFAGRDLEAMSQSLSRVSFDLAAFNRISDADAFDALRQGVAGNVRGLTRLGIIITDTEQKAYALSKGFKGNIADLSEAQQMQLRYGLIMEKTKNIQGEAAKSANTYSGRMKDLSAQWEDFQEAVGKPAMQAAAIALAGINAVVKDTTKNLPAFIELWRRAGIEINNVLAAMHAPGAEAKALYDFAGPELKALGGKNLSMDDVLRSKNAPRSSAGALGSGGGGGGGADDAKNKLKQLKEAMRDLGKTYYSEVKSINRDLDDLNLKHVDALKDIQDEIDDTKTSLRDLEKEVLRINNDLSKALDANASERADAFERQIEKVNALKEQLADAQKDAQSQLAKEGAIGVGTNDKLAAIRDQLKLEEDALNLYKGKDQKGYDTGFSQSKQADFTQEMDRLMSKDAEAKADHTDRLVEAAKEKNKLRDQMADLEKKQALENAVYQNTRQQYELTKTSLRSFQTDYESAMTDISKITEDTVNGLKNKLEEMRSAISSIDALMSARSDLTGGGSIASRRAARLSATPDSFLNDIPHFAEGGIVNRPTVALIGEAGPEAVVPLGKNKSTAAVTVNLGPVYVSKEVDGDALIAKLTRELELYLQRSVPA